jgi:hypothetical protein
MIRALGLIVVLVGLVIVGISGDNHRVPSGRNLSIGAVLMAAGALVAIFATDVALLMGWSKP